MPKPPKQAATAIEVLNAAWLAGRATSLSSRPRISIPIRPSGEPLPASRGNTITLDSKLDYMHFGKITFDVDERGEVGMLSRNILIQASPDADQTLFGGHIMAMTGSRMFVSGVEFNRMG